MSNVITRKLGLALAVCLATVFIVVACDNQQPTVVNPTSSEVIVTVEVTRLVEEPIEVTRFATVAVPIEVTREIYVEVTPQMTPVVVMEDSAVGSAENPLQLIFSPVYGEKVTTARAQNLAAALTESTDLAFEIVQSNSYEQVLETACNNPENAIVLLTAIEYTLAHARCDVRVRYAGVRNGIAWHSGMLVAPRNTDIESLTELESSSWGVRNADDLTVGLYFQAFFETEGINVDSTVELETDTNTLLALAEDEVDFVSAEFVPPILPYEERLWVFGEDDPELWRRTGQVPIRSGIGFIVVVDYVDRGGYQVRDARATVFDVDRSIFQDTEILHVGDPLPNDAVAYGVEIPLGIALQVDAALEAHMQTEACAVSLCSSDFFNWEDVESAENSDYDSVRFVTGKLNLDEAALFEYLNR